MPPTRIDYSEYQSIVDILKKDSDETYTDLMKKEEKTLDTVNKVVKYYRENDYKRKDFLHMNLMEIAIRFTEVFRDIAQDLQVDLKNNASFSDIFFKGDRPIYLGILVIIIAIFVFLYK